ncbi:MAG: tripartite tricarboxylate transporter substrate binding protein [Rhodoplanes sp.]|uniref:Bug family tripartite tricarboxylate transporter substrate binding protein n=1 Tax=Rhodoplanes sp. TaxID=1968906 RepID=UPI00185E62FC|nr:tripartite tricarboxylate transporter substrate binding protein [Rhodoplanes sp.]NVO14995.1 tripartite tricarboxylate transporter substrate binding protein [Rhodoplanes sp.]
MPSKTATRTAFTVAAGLSALSLAFSAAIAPALAEYPERNITLIVPYGAGGGTDIGARMLATDLEKLLGKSVTVENRSGGGGWVGWGALAQARPDGYTLGLFNVPSLYAGYLDPQYKRTETLDSFTPLVSHVLDYNAWSVRADSPYKTVKDVIEAARAKPDTLTVTTYGVGSDDHLALLSNQAESKVRMIAVHFRSTAEGKTQALGGHIDVLSSNVSEIIAEARSGSFRGLGVMAPERSQFHPTVPTFREQGFNQDWSVSRGIAAPAGPPKDVQAKLLAALKTILTSPEHKQKAETFGLLVHMIKGDDNKKFLKDNEIATKKLTGW